MKNLGAFELFMIGGGNPANGLPSLKKLAGFNQFFWPKDLCQLPGGAFAATIGCPPWVAEWLSGIKDSLPLQMWDISPLLEWAVVESLNTGSFHRADTPALIQGLKGSGRWFAGDEGGQFKQMKERLLEWADMPESRRHEFDRAARILAIPGSVVSALAEGAARTRAVRAAENSFRSEVAGMKIDWLPGDKFTGDDRDVPSGWSSQCLHSGEVSPCEGKLAGDETPISAGLCRKCQFDGPLVVADEHGVFPWQRAAVEA